MSFENILLSLIILLSSILQGMFGFAFMLLALPLTSLVLSIKTAVPLLSMFLALISGILAFQLREKFDYRVVIPLIVGAVIGIPFGIYFLLKSSEILIKSALGIILILYSLDSLLVKRVKLRLPAWAGYIFGFFAGALGGAFNITGPAVIIYILTQDWTRINTVGSLNFFFFVTSLLIVAFHIIMGNITPDLAVTFFLFTPVVIAGMLVGSSIFRKMTNENYRKGLFALLLIMGIMLLL